VYPGTPSSGHGLGGYGFRYVGRHNILRLIILMRSKRVNALIPASLPYCGWWIADGGLVREGGARGADPFANCPSIADQSAIRNRQARCSACGPTVYPGTPPPASVHGFRPGPGSACGPTVYPGTPPPASVHGFRPTVYPGTPPPASVHGFRPTVYPGTPPPASVHGFRPGPGSACGPTVYPGTPPPASVHVRPECP
jgi:hypothetical protein